MNQLLAFKPTQTAPDIQAPGTAPSRICLMPGEGIGPEVAASAVRVLAAAAPWIGVTPWAVTEKSVKVGPPEKVLRLLWQTGMVLKGPHKSLSGSPPARLGGLLHHHAEILPVFEIPGIYGPFTGRGVDFVIVRENVGDVFSGNLQMEGPNVAEALKQHLRKGCRKVITTAFDLTRARRRRHLICATNANKLKPTEQLFRNVFEEIAILYPDVSTEHVLLDTCAHRIATAPTSIDVIVTTAASGAILGSLSNTLLGGWGMMPSVGIGDRLVQFQTVDGTACDIAGRDRANPTGMILSVAMMLRHIGAEAAGTAIESALFSVLQEGKVRTADIAHGDRPVSTSDFTDAIIDRLDRLPVAAGDPGTSHATPVPLVPIPKPVLSAGERPGLGHLNPSPREARSGVRRHAALSQTF